MSDYTQTTDFSAKDALPTGNANKLIKGSEVDPEFDAIATAIATKANKISGGTANNVVKQDADGDLVDTGLATPTGSFVGTSDTQTLTNKTLTSPVLNTGVSGTAVLDEDDMASDSDTQLATQQSIKAYIASITGGLQTTVLDIGDWDMDATLTVNVAHGLTLSNIRSVEAVVRNDVNNALYPLPGEASATIGLPAIITSVDSTSVNLRREPSGFFDTTGFDSTSYNRGWVIIKHV